MEDEEINQVPVEDHTAEGDGKRPKYRKCTTDLHPLFSGSKTFAADRKWRADIPRAGADDY